MTRTVVAVICGVLALVVGCGSTGSGAAPTSSATSTAAAASEAPSSATAVAGIPPKPDEATRAAYLDELRSIEPLLVDEDNLDKAVNRGRDQCSSVAQAPTDQAKLIDLTDRRFTAPGHSDGFGPAIAERVLGAVRKHLCPTY